MKKLSYLIVLALILGLTLAGCTLLSNIGQTPTSEQSGITYLTKGSPSVDLVGLWHFDEGIGFIANDSSGSIPPNDGTLMGGTIWDPSGKFGGALSFDGVGDYVQLPASNAILSTNTFTIEAWFKTSVNHAIYGGTEGRLVNLHRMGTASTAVSLYVEQDQIGLLYYTGAAHVFVKYIVDYHDDVWHHIAVTHDATTYKLYYDGVEVASQDDAFGGFGTYPAYLGTYNGSQRFFNGAIDEVRIWDGALTANQIQQSMASPLPVIVTTSRSEPGSVNVNTKEYWDITITVCNYDADNNLTDVVVQGGIGADLVVTEVNSTPIDPPVVKGDPFLGSDFTLTKKGGKMGATIVRGDIETLVSGNCFTLDLVVETGLNPKLKQEFTSPEDDHELDGGFSATYLYDGIEYKTPETEPLTVDVVIPTP